MKKISLIIPLFFLGFLFSMCNTQGNNVETSRTDQKSRTNDKEVSTDACMMPISKEDSAKYISKTVFIKGDVENPLSITVDSLKKMKTTTIDNFKVVCQSGANMKENASCKGVLLKDILEKAKIDQQNHKDRNFYIVARASDNYKATFSWAEIFNNPTGENVYVLFEENGQPIKEQGEMILICKNDIKTGPRHVYWLKSIEVKRVK